jgi:hypothetical protein
MQIDVRLNSILTALALIVGLGLSGYAIVNGNGSPALYVIVAVGLAIMLVHLFRLIANIRARR